MNGHYLIRWWLYGRANVWGFFSKCPKCGKGHIYDPCTCPKRVPTNRMETEE